MNWREVKIALEWIGGLTLVVLFWVPWGTLIRWVKEEVKKPGRSDVI